MSKLSYSFVEAGELTVAMSKIGELRCGEVVSVSAKKRGLPGTLLASTKGYLDFAANTM